MMIADSACTGDNNKLLAVNSLTCAVALGQAAVAEYSRHKGQLDDAQANVLSVLSFGVGAWAACAYPSQPRLDTLLTVH